MNTSARHRFVVAVTAVYAVSALAWIFLSDQLLSAFTDIASIQWLSTVKGVFFVAVSAAMFFFALRSVPDAGAHSRSTLMHALTSGVNGRKSRWPMYVFAVLVSFSALVLHQSLTPQSGGRLMLILFMLPIVLSALLGGLGPGLASTALVALVTDYFVIPPIASFRVAAAQDLLQWCFLIANGIAVSVLSEMLRVSMARVEAKHGLLDAIVSGTDDAVFAKDLQGQYLLANQATARIAGKTVTEILGQDDRQLFSADTARQVMETDRQIIASGHTDSLEERLSTLDGKALVFRRVLFRSQRWTAKPWCSG